jgi:hypothetical protein
MASIPDHVFHDLNYRTFRRYMDEPDFRQSLLSDPAGTNTREELGLSQPTIDWIRGRVQAHGLQNLLSTPVRDVPVA